MRKEVKDLKGKEDGKVEGDGTQAATDVPADDKVSEKDVGENADQKPEEPSTKKKSAKKAKVKKVQVFTRVEPKVQSFHLSVDTLGSFS